MAGNRPISNGKVRSILNSYQIFFYVIKPKIEDFIPKKRTPKKKKKTPFFFLGGGVRPYNVSYPRNHIQRSHTILSDRTKYMM